MTQTLTAADAITHFDEVTARIVETGERVIVTLQSGEAIAMIPASELEPPQVPVAAPDPVRRELAEFHEMLRRELYGQQLNPDPVEMLRRVRNEEFE